MRTFLRDARFALRSLRRRPTFTIVSIATLGLGVGAATSIYSVVDGILLKPLPYHNAERLVAVWQTYAHWRSEPILAHMWDRITFSYPEFREWRAAQRSFVDVAISVRSGTRLGAGETLESVQLTMTTASLANVLQLRPVLGRFFTEAEDVVGGPPVVVLSHDNWMSRYGGDRNVIGTTVRFSRGSYTIIGVLPRGVSLEHGAPASPFWIPLGQDSSIQTARTDHSYPAIGRLKPGVSAAAAAQELDAINESDPHWKQHGAVARQWQLDLTRNVRKPLMLLLGAVLVLMLIACANVATLLLGEAATREHEIAARVALGANRLRVVRQLLTESVVLGAAAAVVGVALSLAGTKLLVALAPTDMPGLANVHVDTRVLAFALLLAVATGLLFGLAPAITMARRDPASLLRGSAGQSRGRSARLQPLFVAVELALSFVLLVGAGLLTRSLLKLSAVNPGFDREQLVAASLSVPGRDSLALHDFYIRARERVAGLPGVVSATMGSSLPFSGNWSSSSIEREGDVGQIDGRSREAQQRVVLPGFFRLLGIPLLAGRDLTDADRLGAPRVMVINKTMASKYFPGESALGKRIRYQRQWWEIVGVVGDVRYKKLSTDLEATLYTPHAQRPGAGMALLVRARQGAGPMVESIRSAIREIDPSVLLTRTDAMPDMVQRSYAEERYRSALILLFSAIAIVLAAAGMYGVVARTVGQRMRELGIRIALGATPVAVMRLVVVSTTAGVALGVGAGFLGALLARDYIAGFLFGISPLDAATYLGVTAILAGVSLLATLVPARRAARVDPAVVLREQ
jgi:putative ABC transport system permease protein